MRKYHDVTIAINDAAPYIPCLESYKTLFRQLFYRYSKFHKLILKYPVLHIQEIQK